MTESRKELIERGWYRSIAFYADAEIVGKMRCNHNACGGHLRLECWHKTVVLSTDIAALLQQEQDDKQFTRCESCGDRKPFWTPQRPRTITSIAAPGGTRRQLKGGHDEYH